MEQRSDCQAKPSPSFNDILHKISGKALLWILGIVVSLASMLYSDMKGKITQMEDRVSFLYQDKISRSEFVAEMREVRKQNESIKADILSRQESMKNDILARLDLMMKRGVSYTLPNKDNNNKQ